MEDIGMIYYLGTMLWLFMWSIYRCFYIYFCTLNMNEEYAKPIFGFVIMVGMGVFLFQEAVNIEIIIK